MSKEKISDTNDLNKRIEHLNKTIRMRQVVLDKMIKKLNEKNRFKK